MQQIIVVDYAGDKVISENSLTASSNPQQTHINPMSYCPNGESNNKP